MKEEVKVPKVDQPYTSGTWIAKPGQEDEFVERWQAFADWAFQLPGAQQAVLLQAKDDPTHFVSVGGWDGQAEVDAWRNGPEFRERIGRVREVCDDFRPSDYSLRAIAE